MDKSVPWRLWGRYEKFPASATSQLVHIGPTKIDFIYRKTASDPESVVNRVFEVTQFVTTGEIIVVMATKRLPGAKSWDIHFRFDDRTWNLHTPDTQKQITRPIPMTKKYLVGRCGAVPVIAVNVVR